MNMILVGCVAFTLSFVAARAAAKVPTVDSIQAITFKLSSEDRPTSCSLASDLCAVYLKEASEESQPLSLKLGQDESYLVYEGAKEALNEPLPRPSIEERLILTEFRAEYLETLHSLTRPHAAYPVGVGDIVFPPRWTSF